MLNLLVGGGALRWMGVVATSSGSGERAAFRFRAEGVMEAMSMTSFSMTVACFDTRVKLLIGAVADVTTGFLRGRPRGRPEAPAIVLDCVVRWKLNW